MATTAPTNFLEVGLKAAKETPSTVVEATTTFQALVAGTRSTATQVPTRCAAMRATTASTADSTSTPSTAGGERTHARTPTVTTAPRVARHSASPVNVKFRTRPPAPEVAGHTHRHGRLMVTL